MTQEQIVVMYMSITLTVILLVVALLLLNKRMNDISNSNKLLEHKVRDVKSELNGLSNNDNVLLKTKYNTERRLNNLEFSLEKFKDKIEQKADKEPNKQLIIVTKDMQVHTRNASDLDKSIESCIYDVKQEAVSMLRTNKGDIFCNDIIAITKSIK